MLASSNCNPEHELHKLQKIHRRFFKCLNSDVIFFVMQNCKKLCLFRSLKSRHHLWRAASLQIVSKKQYTDKPLKADFFNEGEECMSRLESKKQFIPTVKMFHKTVCTPTSANVTRSKRHFDSWNKSLIQIVKKNAAKKFNKNL